MDKMMLIAEARLEMMLNYPEEYDKIYPGSKEKIADYTAQILKENPELLGHLLHALPTNFIKWMDEAENLVGVEKRKKYEDVASILNRALTGDNTDHPFARAVMEKHRVHLEECLKEVESKLHNGSSEGPIPHAQIALIHIAEKKPITKINQNIVAAKWGLTKPNAGTVLRKKYDELDDDTTRRTRRDIERHLVAAQGKAKEDSKQWFDKELLIIRDKQR